MFTPRLLAVLCKHQAKATFFMVGKAAERHPNIVKEVAAAGHAIGNHSWDHPSFPLITRLRTMGSDPRMRKRRLRHMGKGFSVHRTGHQNLLSRLEAFMAWVSGHSCIA
ncbi:MAG: polysaccharide deacetylase family protein [Nitrospiraceae bacterium]|nr:polysaccharide deacetylase family protein [Nitrospiraceae bacterium]